MTTSTQNCLFHGIDVLDGFHSIALCVIYNNLQQKDIHDDIYAFFSHSMQGSAHPFKNNLNVRQLSTKTKLITNERSCNKISAGTKLKLCALSLAES